MKRGTYLLLLAAMLPLAVPAQEVLTPLQRMPLQPVPAGKEVSAALALPFFDDFAAGRLDPARWQAGAGATVTADVSPLAPTVGVLTFDALDAQGTLYPTAATSLFPADTATSLPLRLDGLTAADSLVLSFYLLPGGGTGDMWERMGDRPDPHDTLFLDFYRASDSTWHTVWSSGGPRSAQEEPQWRYVAVAVPDNGYCDSTFRFRFRNYASLESTPKPGQAGNCDYWHVDYLLMDRGRTTTEEAVRDIAFAAPAPAMLKRYRAMPYRQYTAADMATEMPLTITNRYSSELASQYGYAVYDASGTELYAYDGGYENAPSFVADSTYQTATGHARPPVGYTFPTMTAPTEYEVVHAVREGSGGDAHRENDTIRYRQRFDCYYAYDDGSAENGYSLTSTAPQMYLACRFELNRADTLTAVDLHFNATLDGANEHIPFYLTLWLPDEEGKPGETLYRDQTRRFATTPGRFQRYLLETGVEVPAGTLFVGLEQTGNDFINLGYDRSYNTAGNIYYHTDGEWEQSFLGGSLMMRPCFGARATVGMEEADHSEQAVEVYPNPAAGRLWVRGETARLELYDLQGRRVAAAQGNSLDVGSLNNGVYLLRCLRADREPVMKKVIIRH